MRRIHRSDIMEFLSSSTREQYSTLLQLAVAAGLNFVDTRLLQSSVIISVSQSALGQILHRGIEKTPIDTLGLSFSSSNIHVNTIFEGRTAPQVAGSNGNRELVNLLLAHRADVNAKDGLLQDQTALNATAEGGHIDMAEMLLTHEAG